MSIEFESKLNNLMTMSIKLINMLISYTVNLIIVIYVDILYIIKNYSSNI